MEFVNNRINLLVFSIEEQRYGLSLPNVERICRAFEIVPLPKAPSIVMGVINLRGSVIPVINVRRRFGLPEREIRLTDQFIISMTTKRRVALVADSVAGVIDHPRERIIAAESIVPGMEYIQGVARLHDGIVFIHELETFLSLEEESALEEATKR